MQTLEYSITGSGNALVFLHGFCETNKVWQKAHDTLSDQYQVISINLPGYGKSELHKTLTMESMAEAVDITLKSIGIQQYILIGHSMGGYVALAMAEKFKKNIKGISLFHSTAFADTEEKKAQRNKTIAYLNEHGVEAFIRPFVPPLFFPQNRNKCTEVINQLIEEGCKLDKETILSCTIAMRDRPDRTHVLNELDCPVQYIVGKNDMSVKLEDSLNQIHLPKECHVLMLDATAHQGIFEREKETISAIRAFGTVVFGQ